MQRHLSENEPTILDNTTCVYCGCILTKENRTKEHVISRNFVPRGKLNNQWNLIVKCCRECNTFKSILENDIPAITMHPDASGKFHDEDEDLKKEALRKCLKSTSQLTGKPICKSIVTQKIKGTLWDNIKLSYELTGPPQIADDRLFALARLQLMALFYLITYNENSQVGGFWQGSFYPIIATPKSDWGNLMYKEFMNRTVNWQSKLLTMTAEGYYKAMIKRHPEEELWAWAVEWNKNYRAIGLFGKIKPAETFMLRFPERNMHTIYQSKSEHFRIGFETTLAPDDDSLFEWHEPLTPSR